MLEDFRQQYPQYSDMPDDALLAALSKKGLVNANHDNLEDGVSAETSHQLQAIAPEIKPVVKGTKAEVLKLKQTGQIAPGNVIHIGKGGEAYIINAKAVQELYGVSPAQSLKMAKQDLEAGGEIESTLLGYPKRDVENPVTMAVDNGGNVLTDMGDIATAHDQGGVIWAAEGENADVQRHAERVAQKWKTIGEEINDESTESGESGIDGQGQTGDETGQADDNVQRQEGRQVEAGGAQLRPIVFHNNKRMIGEAGQTHDEVLQDKGLPTSIKTRGFITPDGTVLSRKAAVLWLKKNDPQTAANLRGVKRLHTEQYNEAAGI
ncbi:hypothetical protein F6V30_13950 [Oryzomonas sagensis]|uniref:Filamentous hemagglutinin n=1 Tax=Oryzomonas sagensis TaxID=2603857 RepID=A0ABQ6TL82_9BACT|nr:hypothetical protein [Oryzomonas sagensis]KAB0668936.1 hypothetical protein F6V30_13950 [Oryzomonas sagensis]